MPDLLISCKQLLRSYHLLCCTMQLFRSFNHSLAIGFLLQMASSKPWLSPLPIEDVPVSSLDTRQAPAVIATDKFLRRGCQACQYPLRSWCASEVQLTLYSCRCGRLALQMMGKLLMTIVSFNFLLARCEGTDRRALATILLAIDLSNN